MKYIIRSEYALPESNLSLADNDTLVAAVEKALNLSPIGRIEITRAEAKTSGGNATRERE